MKFRLKDFIHSSSAKDRTHESPFKRISRMLTVGLAMILISIPAFIPAILVLVAGTDAIPQASVPHASHAYPIIYAPPLSNLAGEMISFLKEEELNEYYDHSDTPKSPSNLVASPEDDSSNHLGNLVYTDSESPSYEPHVPMTQEIIARRIEPVLNTKAKSGTKISYPYPSGAMAVALYKDGVRILKGQVADIGGTVYVPVQRFADLFGDFKTVYTEATEQVVITGTNLSITVKVGDPYITVNERIFYTGKKVLSLGGWIFVPLTSMCKALNASVNIRSGYYDAFVSSGDPSKVATASEYYNSDDLYWLSRIISAEAKGEPFAGQIAVGNVVLNRVRSHQFPDTVKGVIFDTKYGTQFSPVSSGTIYNSPTSSSIRAAKVCLEGYSLSTRMIYFYNPSIATSTWIGRTRPYIMTIGNHKFYG